MSELKYAVRAADVVRDRESILALWQQAFPATEQHPIKYDWCYGQTPVGVGRLYVLEHGSDAAVIGVQGIVPRRWWCNGEAKPTGICADLVVDKNYRSIGPALTMVRQVIEIEHTLPNAVLLYGFPNTKSEALYRRAGYSKIGEITRYALPLRLHHWLIKKGIPAVLAHAIGMLADSARQLRLWMSTLQAAQRWRCVPAREFDTRFDALWARVAVHAGSMVLRDSQYMQWRFGNNFAGQTQIMVLETHDGKIDGYVVYTVSSDKMVSVMDFLAADNDTVLPAMLKLFVRTMYTKGYIGITTEFTGPESIRDKLIECGFSPRETNPIYAVLGQAESGLLQNAPYFTSSDRDQ